MIGGGEKGIRSGEGFKIQSLFSPQKRKNACEVDFHERNVAAQAHCPGIFSEDVGGFIHACSARTILLERESWLIVVLLACAPRCGQLFGAQSIREPKLKPGTTNIF